jgi:hypothetical protein
VTGIRSWVPWALGLATLIGHGVASAAPSDPDCGREHGHNDHPECTSDRYRPRLFELFLGAGFLLQAHEQALSTEESLTAVPALRVSPAWRFHPALSLGAELAFAFEPDGQSLSDHGDWFVTIPFGFHARIEEHVELIARLAPVYPLPVGGSIGLGVLVSPKVRLGLVIDAYYLSAWESPVGQYSDGSSGSACNGCRKPFVLPVFLGVSVM